MKNQLIALLIMLSLLLLVGGCDSERVFEDKSTDLTNKSKEIQIKDASSLNFVKLRVSSENEDLLKSYSENSFEISFVKPELDTNNAVSEANQVLPSETIASVDIEIIETNIPEYARVSYKNRSNSRALAPRLISVNLFAFAPKNYLWVYNKSSNTANVTFAYNRSASGGSWLGAGTKSLGIRKEASYCNMTAKQIRATYTYDANVGSYDFFTWQYFNCP